MSAVKKWMITAILVVVLTHGKAQRPAVDTSGLSFFWKITALLQRDDEPDERLWDSLFSTPGYKALSNNITIKTNISLVFKPSLKHKLDSIFMVGSFYKKRDLSHLLKVKEQTAALKAYQHTVDFSNAVKKGVAAANNYLPPAARGTLNEVPPIRLVFFSPDARSQGGHIIFDLMFCKDMGEALTARLFGHEAHHFFSNKLPDLPNRGQVYKGVVAALDQLQVEGIADLIDKPALLKAQRKAGKDEYYLYQNNYNRTFQKLDSLNRYIESLIFNKSPVDSVVKRLPLLLPMNYHPNGFYMARLIKKRLGIQVLRSTVGSGATFLRQYNRAARRSHGEYVFPEATLLFIQKIYGLP